MLNAPISRSSLAAMFDHTLLKPYAIPDDFEALCREAVENGFAMVAVNSAVTALCKGFLHSSNVHVGAAVSFPLGQTSFSVKLYETGDAIAAGADEIDYVINVGRLRAGDLSYIRREMEAIVSVCRENNVISKAIFENCYLTKDEIRAAALIARDVCPDFIKTSTGFGTSGAAAEDVRLMKETVGDTVGVKAAGGIRDLRTCLSMIASGATRIGTSSGLKILSEYDKLYR
ncbi:MAG: deoxyribose-phosphate aldolase [Oscillospiraceae bacterium]